MTTTVHDDDKLQVDELTTNTGDHQTIYHIKDLVSLDNRIFSHWSITDFISSKH